MLFRSSHSIKQSLSHTCVTTGTDHSSALSVLLPPLLRVGSNVVRTESAEWDKTYYTAMTMVFRPDMVDVNFVPMASMSFLRY